MGPTKTRTNMKASPKGYGGLPLGDDRISATIPNTIKPTARKIVGAWKTVTHSRPYAHRRVDSANRENTKRKPPTPSNVPPSVWRPLCFTLSEQRRSLT